MYAAFWRALPGPFLVRLLIVLALLAGIIYALFEYGFPWIEPYLPLNENLIEEG